MIMLNAENNAETLQSDTTAIILTYNEEKHIKRCILSINQYVKKIIIIDSFSKDETVKIAKKYNAEVAQINLDNMSKYLNWGLNNIKITTNWILRIDADEFFTRELGKQVVKNLKIYNQDISGISVNRKFIFLKKDINFGGTFPHKTLRIWRTGKGKCQDVWMDEQIIVDGKVVHIDESLIDHNLNKLSWWIKKHKTYSIRESINYLLKKNDSQLNIESSVDNTKLKQGKKMKIYYKFPIFIRPIFLFLYSYVIKFGFLNGWQGFVLCILQVLWFRFLVDINILQTERIIKKQKLSLQEAIKLKYGYEKI